MTTTRYIYILLFLQLLMSFGVWAETIYIDDKLLVGLHQDKSIDSAILKVVPSGTALEVIKQEAAMAQVKTPDGATGWIDNKYLVKTAPGRAQLQEAKDRIAQLENEINNLKTNTTGTNQTAANTELARENEELKQLLKSERLKVGELQAQTAELKNKLAQEPVNNEASKQLEKITREKADLMQQIANLQKAQDKTGKNISIDLSKFNWKKILVTIAVSLIIGIAAGIYIMDLIIRRRHGGFRV